MLSTVGCLTTPHRPKFALFTHNKHSFLSLR